MSSAYNSRGGMQFQSNQTIHPGQLNASMKQASRGAATPSTAYTAGVSNGSILGLGGSNQFHMPNKSASQNTLNATMNNTLNISKSSMKSSKNGSVNRSAKKVLTDSHKMDTVVFKNFPLQTTVEEVRELIVNSGMATNPTEIILHADGSIGAFKGTVFVRFGTQEGAEECMGTIQAPFEFNGRKVKMEMLKRPKKDRFGTGAERQNSKSFTAAAEGQDAAPTEAEMKAIRELVEQFANGSHQEELHLPPTTSPAMRKYQHSVAERFELDHGTVEDKCGGFKYVVLTRRNEAKTRAGKEKESMKVAQLAQQTFNGQPVLGADRSVTKGQHADADLFIPFLAQDVSTLAAAEAESMNVGLLPTPPGLEASPHNNGPVDVSKMLPAQLFNNSLQKPQPAAGLNPVAGTNLSLTTTMAHNVGASIDPFGTIKAHQPPPPPGRPGQPPPPPPPPKAHSMPAMHMSLIAPPPGLESMMSNASIGSGLMPKHQPSSASIGPTMTATVAAVQGLLSGSTQTRLPEGPFAFGPFPASDIARNRSAKIATSTLIGSQVSRKSMDTAKRARGPDPEGIGFQRIRRARPPFNY